MEKPFALAEPANRPGRIAADVIAGRDSRFRGSQETSIIGLFSAAAGSTRVNEKTLMRLGDTDYEIIVISQVRCTVKSVSQFKRLNRLAKGSLTNEITNVPNPHGISEWRRCAEIINSSRMLLLKEHNGLKMNV